MTAGDPLLRRVRGAVLLSLAGFLGACGPASPGATGADAEEHPPFVSEEGPPTEFTRSGDDAAPDRFVLGRAATPDEIAALDIDVMPDGTGLPDGAGTAAGGADVYAARCASCHGPDGMTRVPGGGVLVAEGDRHAFVDGSDPDAYGERTVGNYWPYATTLFDYVRRTMPYDRPGSLTDDEVYAVVAWILWKNELVERDEVVDRSTLPQIEMPARNRFVPDDRLTEIRVH